MRNDMRELPKDWQHTFRVLMRDRQEMQREIAILNEENQKLQTITARAVRRLREANR